MIRPADIAHGILPWLGIGVAMQAPITAYLTSAGAPVRLVDLGFGAAGLVATAWSKHIDSVSYTAIQTSGATAPITTAGSATVPPASPWGPPPPSV